MRRSVGRTTMVVKPTPEPPGVAVTKARRSTKMQGSMASDRNPDVVVTAFLAQVETDIANGITRDLQEYLARYPGYEQEVSAAYEQLSEDLVEDEFELAGELSPGDAFAGYEILAVRGRGGQGVVYEASDPGMGRAIALKVLHRSQLWSPAAHQRFAREVHVMARLSHPGITPVFARGFENGLPWVAMELLEGETIGARLQRQREAGGGDERAGFVDWRRAVRWVHDAAVAVAHAQSAGILHRDLKPGNLWLEHGDRVRVLDFGLAVEFDDDGSKSELTMSGEHFGTPGYMAPEQLSNDFGDPTTATDTFGLGVVLFEAVAGRKPFRSTSLGAYERALLAGPPDVRAGAPQSLPRDLSALLRVALATRPSERYADAAALAADLDRVLEGRPIQAVPPGPLVRVWRWAQRETKLAVAIAGAFLVLLGSLVAVSVAFARAEASAYSSAVTAARALAQNGDFAEARRVLENCPESQRAWLYELLHHELYSGLELTDEVRDAVAAAVASPTLLSTKHEGERLFCSFAEQTIELPVEEWAEPVYAVAADGRAFAVATRPAFSGAARYRVVGVRGDGGLEVVADWLLQRAEANAISFSADGQWLWGATSHPGERERPRLYAWRISCAEAGRNAALVERILPGARVSALLGLPDGSVALGRQDGVVERVTLAEDIAPVPMAFHAATIGRLVRTPVGFASVDNTGSVRHWDVTLRGAARRLDIGEHGVYALRWREDHAVEIWTYKGCRAVWRPRDHILLPVGDVERPAGSRQPGAIIEPKHRRAEHPTEPIVATGTSAGLLALAFDGQAATMSWRTESAGVSAVAFSPDGAHLAVGHDNGAVAVYSAERFRSGHENEVAATERAWQLRAELGHDFELLRDTFALAGHADAGFDAWDEFARLRLGWRREGRVWDVLWELATIPFAPRAVREWSLDRVRSAVGPKCRFPGIELALFEGALRLDRLDEAAAMLDAGLVVSPGSQLLFHARRGTPPTPEELAELEASHPVRVELVARQDRVGTLAWEWLTRTTGDGVRWSDVLDRLKSAEDLPVEARARAAEIFTASIDDHVRASLERTCAAFFRAPELPAVLADSLRQWAEIVGSKPTPRARSIHAAVLLRAGDARGALDVLESFAAPDFDWAAAETLGVAVYALAQLESENVEAARRWRDRLLLRRSKPDARDSPQAAFVLHELARKLR